MGETPSLAEIDQQAWSHLAAATQTPPAPLRCLTLASVDARGHPQARTLILRAADPALHVLEFHTDTRSEKWRALNAAPQTSVLGYDAGLRIQLRFSGTVKLFGPGSDQQQEAWQGLAPWNRNAYCGGPPGHAIAKPEIIGPQDSPPSDTETAKGHARFGLIRFTATRLDWYQHGRGSNLRAVFDYAAGTERWVTP